MTPGFSGRVGGTSRRSTAGVHREQSKISAIGKEAIIKARWRRRKRKAGRKGGALKITRGSSCKLPTRKMKRKEKSGGLQTGGMQKKKDH